MKVAVARLRAQFKAEKSKKTAATVYPSRPPYERFLKDGKIRLMMYLDNDSALKTTYVRMLRAQGFVASEKPDGSVVFKKKDVELDLQPLPQDYAARAAQPVLAKMNEPDVDGVIYLGHSYY